MKHIPKLFAGDLSKIAQTLEVDYQKLRTIIISRSDRELMLRACAAALTIADKNFDEASKRHSEVIAKIQAYLYD